MRAKKFINKFYLILFRQKVSPASLKEQSVQSSQTKAQRIRGAPAQRVYGNATSRV